MLVRSFLIFCFVLWSFAWVGAGDGDKPLAQGVKPKTSLSYDTVVIAQNHLKSILLNPVIPLNAMRRQIYAKLGNGEKEGIAGWEKFTAKQGIVRACIVPGSDGAERATIVALKLKDKLSWRDLLKSDEAMSVVPRLRRNEDGKKTLQIRVNQLDSYYAMQITLICGEEWIEQITWTLVG